MMRVSMNRIDELFCAISSETELFLPAGMGKDVHYDVWSDDKKVLTDPAERVNYNTWDENKLIRMDVLNTTTSVKDLFFPQHEDIASFQLDGKKMSVEPAGINETKFAVFGVRPCDAKSLEILDRVFLSDPVDAYYQARRENGTVIVLACNKPNQTCFCNVFGIDATAPAGDITTWMEDGWLYWLANTEKGQKMTDRLKDFLEETDTKELDAAIAKTKEIFKKLPLNHLSTKSFGQGKTNELFDSPKWKELSQSCLGCGTCTYVCPTCQCYDIRDFDTGYEVKRFRCWDSCMYSDFTMMAHGNPRTSQLERFRQRFMHKLVYFPDKNEGEFSCVGCGRCLVKCPISMNITKVMQELGAAQNE